MGFTPTMLAVQAGLAAAGWLAIAWRKGGAYMAVVSAMMLLACSDRMQMGCAWSLVRWYVQVLDPDARCGDDGCTNMENAVATPLLVMAALRWFVALLPCLVGARNAFQTAHQSASQFDGAPPTGTAPTTVCNVSGSVGGDLTINQTIRMAIGNTTDPDEANAFHEEFEEHLAQDLRDQAAIVDGAAKADGRAGLAPAGSAT